MEGGAHLPRRRIAVGALALALFLVLVCCPASGTEVQVPAQPGDDPDPGSDAVGAPQVPQVPGGDGPDPAVGDDDFDTHDIWPPVETAPLPDDDPGVRLPPGAGWLLVVLVVLGVISAYAPGEIRRMRIEAAFRESMFARLALARGDFAEALAGFDRAIEQAHTAYTRRVRIGKPAQWTIPPDGFYISLWRGRAAALMCLGRERAAAFISAMADELEAVVDGGD